MVKQKRWVAIASAIKVAIRRGELDAGSRIASEIEMASQWNVSPMTVHRALTELQREGWVIRRRKAGTVVADRSILPDTKIALVFTALSELPQVAYLSGIEESLADGYQLVPMGTSHSPRDEARCFERTLTECSAMICYPTGAQENNVLLKKIVDTMPVIFVDRLPEDIDADVVMTDNFSSMMMGLKYLQSQGHTRIAYFMEDKLHLSSVRDRYSAYQQFIREECGVVDTDRWVRRFSIATPWEQYYDKIEAVLAELLSDTGPNRVTAVACQQDMLMAAVLEACVHIGVTVPTELSILSFNDIPSKMQPLTRSVNRLVQRSGEMGNMAARRIQQRLTSGEVLSQQMRVLADLYPAATHTLSDAARDFIASRQSSKR
jgi:GntR family transcriptional regulator of arabinose operon